MTRARETIVIGTRGSRLAIWQAEWVRSRLLERHPQLTVTLQRIKTSGDKITDVPLAKMGGKGLFVKEIEEALQAKAIDLAVHSMKDVPTALPDGLELICIPTREIAADALISRDRLRFTELRPGARIGTSSLRRQAQLLHRRADLRVETLRGNLDTRLKKLGAGEFDAVILAAAGLRRLGWEDDVTEYLSYDVCLPAMGQGALGIEGRADDAFVRSLVSPLEDRDTRISVTAERALLNRLQGGCQVPIAVHGTVEQDTLGLDALVASIDGRRLVRDQLRGTAAEAASLGERLAEQLLHRGADAILKDIYGSA
ncbi:MAG TPA: hydroxymethylbilane synthase [Nitrospirales bacterium]|nr:hydroxymethylbilane synthase [Nitrospirales bacterium]